MLRKIFVLISVLFVGAALSFPLQQQNTNVRNVYRFNVTSPELLKMLKSDVTGVDIWTEKFGLQSSVDVLAPASEFEALLANFGIHYDVMINDLDEMLEKQKQEREAVKAAGNADYNAVYHSYEEIVDRLKEFEQTYPQVVEYIPSIGKSVEGRDVPAVRFGLRATKASDKVPTVWLQCNIHSREWIAGATCMYMLQKLFEGANGEYKDLFQGLQFLVAPMVNPDGFTYSMEEDRMWRKNRRKNKDGSIGVDLNRNWGDHWGGEGASPTPSSDTYRGASAFSEPETSNIKNFLAQEANAGSWFQTGIDFHSYGQLILRPYGWTMPDEKTPPNDAAVKKIADKMRDIIKGVHGTVFTSEHAAELYVACGGADDWMSSTIAAQKMAFTFELRDTGRYGFALPDKFIIPTGEEVLPAIVSFARDVIKGIPSKE